MGNSTIGNRREKPSKPYPDFPLFPHASRRWAKKVKGKFEYFGSWADGWEAALAEYERNRDRLYVGKARLPKAGGVTVADLSNRFLTAKMRQRDAGELSGVTFNDYHRACGMVVAAFGKDRPVVDLTSEDFEELRSQLAKRYGPTRLGTTIQMIRTACGYGFECGLLDKPVRFGPMFKRPSKRVLRAERQKKGPKMFEAAEIRLLLENTGQPIKAMIMLGINGGFGNHDCATLPQSAIDFKTNWIDHPRPKTAVERRVPIWPETAELLAEAIELRPAAREAEHERLAFLTRFGRPWTKDDDNTLAKEFRKLLGKLNLHRPGLGFYALRHTFETIAGESRDQVAVSHIMGHVDASMAGVYRERIGDERLRECTEVVRTWLFEEGGAK